MLVYDTSANAIRRSTITNAALVGPQGPTGATGAQGPAGSDGATGAQGPAGADGATGPQGPTGATGATGAQGPAGAAGTGDAPSVSHRTGSTGGNGWNTFSHNIITFPANQKFLVHGFAYFIGRDGSNNTFGNDYLWKDRQINGNNGAWGKMDVTGSFTQHFNSGQVFMMTTSSTCYLRVREYSYYKPGVVLNTRGHSSGGPCGSSCWAIRLA